MTDSPDSMNAASSAGASIDSLDLPPLSSVGVDGDLAAAVGERRLRALLLGEQMPALRVGRYELERQLGAGGMGSVWRAWDEQLRRPIALKFLHRSHETEAGQRRFEREAQGLAQLSHPNVVAVYDVGRHEERIWIAMEFVPGRTLRTWQAEQEPSAKQLLEVWLAAGRGLAAVHAAGLLHRDVKPDNIMMGDDGRVRLVDFGLVRELDSNKLETLAGSGRGEASTTEGGGSQTKTGAFVGTPAYAAPEQLAGESVDDKADQYAFCVALWESLTGARPERGPREGGHLPADSGRMSPRVRRALERGLAHDPGARFATMNLLLDALAPRRRAWLIPAITAAAAGSLGVGLALAGGPEAPDPCAGAGEAITQTWTPERRAALVEAHGAEGAEHIAGIVDGWTDTWVEVAGQTCEAHARGELDDARNYEAQQSCLAGGRRELDRLLGAVEAGEIEDPSVVLAWLAELPDPQRCASQTEDLSDTRTPPTALLDAISTLEGDMARVRHNLDDRPLGERLARAIELHGEAQALAWPPLVLRTAVLTGKLAVETGSAKLAREHFGLAHDLALELRDPSELLQTAGGMAKVEVRLQLDAEAGDWWIAREAAAVEASGGRPESRADLALQRGRLAELRGELELAERSYEAAIGGFRAAGPRFEYFLALALRVHANLLVDRGRAELAELGLEEARALEAAGAPPPMVPESVAYDAGVNALSGGEAERAVEIFTEVLDAARANHGPRSMFVLRAHIGLAGAYDALGKVEDALGHATRADALAQQILGPTHLVRAEALSALGAAQYRQRRFDAAVASFERALTITIEHTRSDSLDRGLALLNLGDALYEHGSDDLRAQTVLTRARTILTEQIGPQHPVMAVALKPLAGLALRAEQPSEARALIDAALAIVERGGSSGVEAAEIRWLAAQAHARTDDPEGARVHASAAADAFAAMGEQWQPRADEIHDWLRALPLPSSSNTD